MSSTDQALLRDLLSATKDGDWGKSEPHAGYVPYRVIRGTDFAKVRMGDVANVPMRYLPGSSVYRRTLRADDIIIETAGGTFDRPTGRTLLITQRTLDALGSPATCASFARFLRVDPALADPQYVFWYLQGLYQAGEMAQHEVRHTGVGRFQYTHFASTHWVPLPPHQEQQAIAGTLGTLDAKIESNRRLRDLATNLVDAMASDLITASTRTAQLDEVVSFNLLSTTPGELTGEIDYIDIASVSPGIVDEIARLTWAQAPSRARRRVSDGDVIYSTVRPGRRSFAQMIDPPQDTVVSTGFAVMTPTQRLGSSLLTSVVSSVDFCNYLESVAQGSAYPAVSIQAMGRYSFQLPDSSTAVHFESRTMPLRRRAHLAAAESRRLVRLRDALLPELLSGRIRVKDAEDFIVNERATEGD